MLKLIPIRKCFLKAPCFIKKQKSLLFKSSLSKQEKGLGLFFAENNSSEGKLTMFNLIEARLIIRETATNKAEGLAAGKETFSLQIKLS